MSQTKKRLAGFIYTQPKTFIGRWDDTNFGLLNGVPFCSDKFESAEDAKDFFIQNHLFILALIEKMTTFIEVAKWDEMVSKK